MAVATTLQRRFGTRCALMADPLHASHRASTSSSCSVSLRATVAPSSNAAGSATSYARGAAHAAAREHLGSHSIRQWHRDQTSATPASLRTVPTPRAGTGCPSRSIPVSLQPPSVAAASRWRFCEEAQALASLEVVFLRCCCIAVAFLRWRCRRISSANQSSYVVRRHAGSTQA